MDSDMSFLNMQFQVQQLSQNSQGSYSSFFDVPSLSNVSTAQKNYTTCLYNSQGMVKCTPWIVTSDGYEKEMS